MVEGRLFRMTERESFPFDEAEEVLTASGGDGAVPGRVARVEVPQEEGARPELEKAPEILCGKRTARGDVGINEEDLGCSGVDQSPLRFEGDIWERKIPCDDVRAEIQGQATLGPDGLGSEENVAWE